jgi:hypothetical protein
MLYFLFFSLVAGVFAPSQSARADPAQRITADVVVTRLATERWRVDYTFEVPVSGIAYGPPVAGFREQAWRVETPGIQRVMRGGREALTAADSARSRFSILVDRYTRFASDHYAPFIPYSDGGAAIYLGFFAGNAIVDEREYPVDFRFHFVGLPAEHVVPPGEQTAGAYVYFGPQEPLTTDQARLVLDPGTPPWLLNTFLRVTESATRLFSDRLGGSLPVAPLVLVGAGEIDRSEGYSVKGGVVGNQLVMLLRGRSLREDSDEVRARFERLTAHELAHLWQLHSLPEAFDGEQPWLHEGAAEAIAVYALGASGIWEPSAVRQFASSALQRCQEALGGSSLPEVTRRGHWEAVYACGFGLFWSADADPLSLWSRLVIAVSREGQSYDQATLERILTGSGVAPRP